MYACCCQCDKLFVMGDVFIHADLRYKTTTLYFQTVGKPFGFSRLISRATGSSTCLGERKASQL
ncbi:unnamed protein product [Acanthoscelides obtectus]|nr:unnamed protein product [Acanthoscelides obtectus]CAK1654689.1 hypothetical protein AOBTE_LOCUS18771 [Acanthoscelides obtectus]